MLKNTGEFLKTCETILRTNPRRMMYEGSYISRNERYPHTVPLSKASEAYQLFNDHEDESIKFVLKP